MLNRGKQSKTTKKLEQALRENLKKRKLQQKERANNTKSEKTKEDSSIKSQ